jgi:hypothetical protein
MISLSEAIRSNMPMALALVTEYSLTLEEIRNIPVDDVILSDRQEVMRKDFDRWLRQRFPSEYIDHSVSENEYELLCSHEKTD